MGGAGAAAHLPIAPSPLPGRPSSITGSGSTAGSFSGSLTGRVASGAGSAHGASSVSSGGSSGPGVSITLSSAEGIVVQVDESNSDFRHFSPMSFSSLHKPQLLLLKGRLLPEAEIDLEELQGEGEEEAAQQQEGDEEE